MAGFGIVGLALAGLGVYGLVELLQNRAKNSSVDQPQARTKCRIPTNVAIFQANQAFLSHDIQFIQATMAIFEAYGCRGEAQAMRDYLEQNGYKPDVPILPIGVETAGEGKVIVHPGETWRAAAILGGIGCAVSLQTIAEKVAARGFTQVSVYSKNPGWGSAWDANEGFLECTRYIQATVSGGPRAETKPKQVYRLEKVSQSA